MHMLRLLPALLAIVLITAACAGQPAAPAAPAEEMAMEETADTEMADTEMAETDAATADDAMDKDAGGEAQADTMDSDAGDMEKHEEMAMDSDSADSTDSAEMAESAESSEQDVAEAAGEPAAGMERPAWQQIALTDARTGAQFALADYAGKTVFVEPFATWCGNCRRQLGNVQSAYTASGDGVLFIALSVEPNIANEALVNYADKEGFEYTFAAMPPEMLQELASIYGQTIGNPPATPHFIIRPDGTTTDLVTGIEGSEVLLQQIQAAAG